VERTIIGKTTASFRKMIAARFSTPKIAPCDFGVRQSQPSDLQTLRFCHGNFRQISPLETHKEKLYPHHFGSSPV
jgi:hypothetical protein